MAHEVRRWRLQRIDPASLHRHSHPVSRWPMRIAGVVLDGFVLLAISACLTTSRPDHGYSSQRGSPSGYSSSKSLPGGPSYQASSVFTAADLGPGEPIPAHYAEDRSQSAALTNYLQKRRLPLVGAQVFTNGDRRVMLHGFVATDFGRQDAAVKSRRYMNDPRLSVVNRIVVRPELLASGDSSAGSSQSPSAPSPSLSYGQDELGTVESYDSQAQSQRSQREFNTLVLLIQLMSLFF